MRASLLARVKRLEGRRGSDYRVIELLLDTDPSLTTEERAECMAAARRRWLRGVNLEQLLAASFETSEATPCSP
jgi:hypothetical protein